MDGKRKVVMVNSLVGKTCQGWGICTRNTLPVHAVNNATRAHMRLEQVHTAALLRGSKIMETAGVSPGSPCDKRFFSVRCVLCDVCCAMCVVQNTSRLNPSGESTGIQSKRGQLAR